jgi:flagellar biogenesis protein FliO
MVRKPTRSRRSCEPPPPVFVPQRKPPNKELNLTIVGILIVIILILLAIYLFRRVV